MDDAKSEQTHIALALMADRQDLIRSAVAFLTDPKVSILYVVLPHINPFSRLRLPHWPNASNFSKPKVSLGQRLRKQ